MLETYIYCKRKNPENNFLFKVNDRNTRSSCEICLKLTIKTLQRCQEMSFWCLYCQLWKYFTPFSSVFIVEFEQVNVCWEEWSWQKLMPMIHNISQMTEYVRFRSEDKGKLNEKNSFNMLRRTLGPFQVYLSW